MYLGFTDDNKEKTWQWEDRVAVSYKNWAKGQPSGGSEHCGIMNADGTWDDYYCHWGYPQSFACKKKFEG